MKIFLTVLKLYRGHNFHTKISKGHNSVQHVGRVTVLFVCTSSDGDLYFYKVS